MRDMHDPALLIIVVYLLGGVAVIEAAALVFVWAALTRSRREAAELRQRVDPRTWLWTGGRERSRLHRYPGHSRRCLLQLPRAARPGEV